MVANENAGMDDNRETIDARCCFTLTRIVNQHDFDDSKIIVATENDDKTDL